MLFVCVCFFLLYDTKVVSGFIHTLSEKVFTSSYCLVALGFQQTTLFCLMQNVVKSVTTLLRRKYNTDVVENYCNNALIQKVYNKSINVGFTNKFKQTHNIRSSFLVITRIFCVDFVYERK